MRRANRAISARGGSPQIRPSPLGKPARPTFPSQTAWLGQFLRMTSTPHLRLGTRRSPLAMAQAEEARWRLCKAHGWVEADVELVPVIASGDRIQDRPLADIGGKALWT